MEGACVSGTAPEPGDAPGASPDVPGEDEDPAYPRRRRAWPWLLVVLIVVLVVVAVRRPWDTATPVPETEPPASTITAVTPSASPTAPTTAAPVPGADAVFDAATAATLLVTAADVEAAVPAAAAGVSRGLVPGTIAWGLPAGSTVDPPSCTTAVTIVEAPPVHHDATSWVNEEVSFVQDVVVLPDAAAARAAFRALVTVLDECPRYAQLDGGAVRTSWVAEPALEGQGVFPAIVHDVTAEAGGATLQQTTGHVLVGNAIVTWTAAAPTAQDREKAVELLGEPAELSAAVEQRALAAVRTLP